jgi:hypothetical protein
MSAHDRRVALATERLRAAREHNVEACERLLEATEAAARGMTRLKETLWRVVLDENFGAT